MFLSKEWNQKLYVSKKHCHHLQRETMDLYDEFGNYVGPEISKNSPERSNHVSNEPISNPEEDRMDEDGANNNNNQLITQAGNC